MCRWLRRSLFHDKAGDIVFRAALAPFALAAALLAIPADEAMADFRRGSSGNSEHSGDYPLHCAAGIDGNLTLVVHLLGSTHYSGYRRITVDTLDVARTTHTFGHTSYYTENYSCIGGSQEGYNRVPLHWAARYGHATIVATLIAAGANVNAKDRATFTRNTPLHWAVRYGHATIAATLIAAGADVREKDYYGNTHLHRAARYGHVDVVSALIAAGVEVNEKNRADATPLRYIWNSDKSRFYSSYSGAVAVLLIAAGGHWGESCVNGNVANPEGPSPSCICESPNVKTNLGACEVVAECDSPSVLNARTNRCDCPAPNAGTDGADAPGNCAVASVESCGGLTPAKFYDSDARECIPLATCRHDETRNTGTNVCECLAPNVLVAGNCRAPSIYYCAQGFDPDRFYDREAGECIPFVECHPTATAGRYTNECECPYYMRPDGSCVSSCDRAETVVGYQCECTADTATNVNGVCELLYPCHDSAIRKADNSGCECPGGTFSHGDPSGGYHRSRSYDRYGERPIIPDTAICHTSHAPIPHNPSGWESAVYANNPTLVAHFISGHGRDPDENYALHLAAEGGYYLAAKTLIESGADINLKRYYGSGYGDPPLHFAVRNGRAKLITLLLRRGADADAQSDDDGDTALHLAAQRTDAAENAGLIAFLLDAGADPNIRNDDGWRPLDLAYHGGTPSDLTWQARRGMMAALIAGGATWSDECTSGAIPNENYRPSSGIADCVCPLHISERDSRGRCECPGHSHAQVNGRCLPKDSAQVEAEILKMEAELLRLRAALVSLNAKLTAAAEIPREMVEEIAEQAGDTAQEIKRRRDNFLALARADLAGPAPPPVAMSDTAAECRMLGGEVQIHSATGIRVCSGIDANDTFCLVDSGDAYPCRGLFRHVRTCNDDYNRPALNPFFCGAQCGERAARGDECE